MYEKANVCGGMNWKAQKTKAPSKAEEKIKQNRLQATWNMSKKKQYLHILFSYCFVFSDERGGIPFKGANPVVDI